MEIWNTDPLKDFVKNFGILLGASEEFPKKANELEIFRDDNFNINIVVRSHANDRPESKKIILGRVYKLDNSVSLSGYVGAGTIRSFSQTNLTSKIFSPIQDAATVTTFSAAEIEYTVSDSKVDYTIEQVANIPGHFIWPNSSKSHESGEHEINFPGDPPIIIKTKLPSAKSFTSSCARFTFDSHIVIISIAESPDIPKSKRPGYIYYGGHPDKATREKIRASISFAFGSPLVYFCSKFFTMQGGMVGFEAVSPSTIGGRAWDVVSQPFAPITSNGSDLLDSSLLQKIALGFYQNHETLNLKKFIFRLWYAEVSPPYMKPAYYGAMIESIQKREIEKLDSKISHTIIDKSKYRLAIKTLSKFLEKQEIPSEAKMLFLNKIQNGNTAPQRVLSDRFYSVLGLILGELEKSSWDKRNNAAHGKEEADDSVIESIRSTKILRIILGRIIIRLINGSDEYIDYYTFNHPIRNLTDPIPQNIA